MARVESAGSTGQKVALTKTTRISPFFDFLRKGRDCQVQCRVGDPCWDIACFTSKRVVVRVFASFCPIV